MLNFCVLIAYGITSNQKYRCPVDVEDIQRCSFHVRDFSKKVFVLVLILSHVSEVHHDLNILYYIFVCWYIVFTQNILWQTSYLTGDSVYNNISYFSNLPINVAWKPKFNNKEIQTLMIYVTVWRIKKGFSISVLPHS